MEITKGSHNNRRIQLLNQEITDRETICLTEMKEDFQKDHKHKVSHNMEEGLLTEAIAGRQNSKEAMAAGEMAEANPDILMEEEEKGTIMAVVTVAAGKEKDEEGNKLLKS